jgi:uncharacterized membrane protein (DUF485 family)
VQILYSKHLKHVFEPFSAVWFRSMTRADWRTLESAPEFRALVAARRRFTIPATVTFVAYYFALPIAVGAWPELMERKLWGSVNLAYLFALSQFFMAWAIMWLYVRKARAFDRMAQAIRNKAST